MINIVYIANKVRIIMKTIVPFALSFLFALPAFAQESAYVDLYSTKDFSTPLGAADGKTTYFKY